MTYSGLHYDELRKQAQLESWQRSEEQNVPLGYGLANAVEGGIQRGVGWLQEQAEDDPDKWTDDALRLMGGGLKNISKIPGMGLIGKVGEAGGHVGGGIAEMMGVDRRIGSFVGSMAADAALGAGVGKVARIGKTAYRIDRLQKAGAILDVDHALRAAKGKSYGFAFGDAGEFAAKVHNPIGAAATTTKKGHQLIKRKSLALTEELKPKRTVDFSKLPQSKRRDAIANYIDEFYTAGMTPAQKATYKEMASFGGGAIEKGQGFQKSVAGAQRNIFGGASHHFGIDLGLAGQTLNRSDAAEIMKYLNAVDVFPGNHPNNYILAYHDYTKKIVDAQKAAIMKATGKSHKEIDKFLKKVADTKMLGRDELADLNMYEAMDELQKLKEINKQSWHKFTDGKIDPKDLDLPEAVIGTDHQEFIHGIGDKLPKRQKLIELAKTDKWLELSPHDAAHKIAEVAREQQNVALNVNKWRLDKIKKAMIKDGITDFHWTDIQAWMIQNPRRAAHLDWHRTARLGVEMTPKRLVKDLPYKDAKEVAEVFLLEKVPQTSKLIRQFTFGFKNEAQEWARDLRIGV